LLAQPIKVQNGVVEVIEFYYSHSVLYWVLETPKKDLLSWLLRQAKEPDVPVSPLWLGNLPPEIRMLLIEYLSDDDMLTLRLVSKAACELVDMHWRPLRGMLARCVMVGYCLEIEIMRNIDIVCIPCHAGCRGYLVYLLTSF
jgi:hypothetical protein